ncbi:MAG: hypothetical protein H7327_15550 [Herminiimonas sp.]|nr:hypothetical protein [Herminiimonas sp.]
MTSPSPISIDPIKLLQPLSTYIVEDLSNADISATATLAASALSELAEPILKMLTSVGTDTDDIALHFFPDPDDPSTPGNLFFWPTTRTSRDSTFADASSAEYSLRAAVFLSERDDYGAVYPAGFNLLLKMEASACELVRDLPASVFEKLEFALKGSSLPSGFEFLDDIQHLPLMPGMRRQFLKAITRAHEVTAKSKRREFEAVMLNYIWDETEPHKDFSAVLSTMVSLFVAIHQQAKR